MLPRGKKKYCDWFEEQVILLIRIVWTVWIAIHVDLILVIIREHLSRVNFWFIFITVTKPISPEADFLEVERDQSSESIWG